MSEREFLDSLLRMQKRVESTGDRKAMFDSLLLQKLFIERDLVKNGAGDIVSAEEYVKRKMNPLHANCFKGLSTLFESVMPVDTSSPGVFRYDDAEHLSTLDHEMKVTSNRAGIAKMNAPVVKVAQLPTSSENPRAKYESLLSHVKKGKSEPKVQLSGRQRYNPRERNAERRNYANSEEPSRDLATRKGKNAAGPEENRKNEKISGGFRKASSIKPKNGKDAARQKCPNCGKYGHRMRECPSLYDTDESQEQSSSRRTTATRKRKFETPTMANVAKRKREEEEKRKAEEEEDEIPEDLKVFDKNLVERIMNEIMTRDTRVSWDDVAGLGYAKKCLQEMLIWPLQRPDLFKGIRGPPKGLLLFGPPGTGKTLLGKVLANSTGATFFSISASSLTSKWVGEGEKMVRALFGVARHHQPSIIFIDEIDSLLCQRSDGDMEASRRLKTEFLVQLDGANTDSDDKVFLIGATNRPHDLDEAARRRLVKRLYIPLPSKIARLAMLDKLVEGNERDMAEEDVEKLLLLTKGYSGSDMRALCTEASYGPLRGICNIMEIQTSQVRKVALEDFEAALKQVRASVDEKELGSYIAWNEQFGSFPAEIPD